MRFESFYTTTQIIYSNNNQLIKFPTKDLDLSYFYIGDKSKANCIYDLCGVIHITDTLDFGNYYATIKNYINSEDWYLFKGNFSFALIKLHEKIIILLNIYRIRRCLILLCLLSCEFYKMLVFDDFIK